MADKNHKKRTAPGSGVRPGAGSLGTTVGSFASRLKRKLQEQAEIGSELLKAHEERKVLMMSAMTTIRRALQDISKINLGERFQFRIEVSDWEGWPRVEVNLIDALVPENIERGMTITAYDRKDQGIINIETRTGRSLGRVFFDTPQEASRLPLVLKKALRDFLDDAGQYVLNPKSPEDLAECQAKPVETAEFDAIGDKLSREEVFSDDLYLQDQNRVSESEEAAPLGPVNISNK